jgi:hypothetical protein
MLLLSQPSWFEQPNSIVRAVFVINLLILYRIQLCHIAWMERLSRKFVQAVTFLACIREVFGSNVG